MCSGVPGAVNKSEVKADIDGQVNSSEHMKSKKKKILGKLLPIAVYTHTDVVYVTKTGKSSAGLLG